MIHNPPFTGGFLMSLGQFLHGLFLVWTISLDGLNMFVQSLYWKPTNPNVKRSNSTI